MKVLLVEDEVELAADILQYLSKEGYALSLAKNLFEAEDALLQHHFDIILLDLGLPDGDGLSVLDMVQSQNIALGIIIITARNAVEDKVTGLEKGADDYLTKPFHLAELNARIKAIIRRRAGNEGEHIVFQELTVSPNHQEVVVGDTTINLTQREWQLLLYFLGNRGRVLVKQAIADHLSDELHESYNPDFIYTHVKNLRHKLQAAGAKDYIQSVYGMGYKWQEI